MARPCLTAAVVGAVAGWLGARVVLVGSGLVVVPWAALGLAFGARSTSRADASIVGATYGFVLSVTFLVAGYRGHAPITTALPLFGALGAFGALCGLSCSCLGRSALVRLRLRQPDGSGSPSDPDV